MKPKLSSGLLVAFIVAFGGFVFGFDASVISGVVSFVSIEFNLSAIEQGIVVSAPTLGAAIAALVAGSISDKVGRKKVLLIVAFLYLVSAVLSAFAVSYMMLVMARTIGGFAFASLILAPMYIAEISTPANRGKMISINQFNIVIGLSVAYFTNFYLVSLLESDVNWLADFGLQENIWRWMLGLEILPALIFFIMLFFVPESPRFLMLKGQEDKAKKVLERLHGKDEMEVEFAEIAKTTSVQKYNIVKSLKQLFSNKMRFVLLLGIIVAIAQQATGVNAIYFYAPTIFEQSGVGTNAAFSQAVWVGVINVIFTVVALMLIDKIGRKPLLIIGLAGIFISMSVCYYGFSNATYKLPTAAAEQMQLEPKAMKNIVDVEYQSDLQFKSALKGALGDKAFNKHQAQLIKESISMDSGVILFGILGFVASFAVSLGPVMWVLLAELFPNHIRGVAISVVGFINSGVSFSVQLLFPWQLANLGTAMTFLMFGVVAVLSLALILWLLPETKGKSLEQIERELVN